MCIEGATNCNKTLVCQVGDLQPGRRYRTPEGDDILITEAGNINMATGRLRPEPSSEVNAIKLGTDRQGRLYASRYLNQPKTEEIIATALDLGGLPI